VLLFCVASWPLAGVTGASATAMVVRSLVERDTGDEPSLTNDGRAGLEALLSRRS
jgi:hypothetical protein